MLLQNCSHALMSARKSGQKYLASVAMWTRLSVLSFRTSLNLIEDLLTKPVKSAKERQPALSMENAYKFQSLNSLKRCDESRGSTAGMIRDPSCTACMAHAKPRCRIVCPQARVGDLLLSTPDKRMGGCDCLLESNGVRSLVVEKLGVVIDTVKGVGVRLNRA